MTRIIIWLVLFIAFVETSELIERENGYFITGKGCGVDTPLKYLNYVPEKLVDFPCTFINMENSIPVILTEDHKSIIYKYDFNELVLFILSIYFRISRRM